MFNTERLKPESAALCIVAPLTGGWEHQQLVSYGYKLENLM